MKIIYILFITFISYESIAGCNNVISNSKFLQDIKELESLKKTNFYANPTGESKLNSLFIIKGDHFTSYLINKGFVFGGYKNKDGDIISGWLNKGDLIELKDGIIKVEDLNFDDFTIYTSFGNIKLSGDFPEFYKKWGSCEINKQQEIGVSGNFQDVNDGYYKYFEHYWDGAYIKTSNINFKKLKLDFDVYRITEINVSNNKYMTNRGIYVGMKEREISNAYGNCHVLNDDSCIFNYKNNRLTFNILNGVITGIDMEELPL